MGIRLCYMGREYEAFALLKGLCALPKSASSVLQKPNLRRRCMSWKTPKILEIALGAEINCYASAELTA